MGSGWSSTATTLIIITEGGGFSGLFFYAPAPGKNQLVGSWAAAAGTDPFGNTYPAGLEVGNGIGEAVGMELDGMIPVLYWDAGTPNTNNFFAAFAETIGTGTDSYGQWVVNGQQDKTQKDFCSLTLNASSQSGVQPAQWLFTYNDPGGTGHVYAFESFGGFTVQAGTVTAVQPGTGSSRSNPAAAETWHTPTPSALWTTTGTAQPVRYRYMPDGTVLLDGELITAGAGPWPANASMFSLPAGYMPAQSCPFVTRSDIAVAAGQATVNVLNSGGVQNGQAFTAAGQRLWFTNVRFPTT